MLKLIGKKILTIMRSKMVFNPIIRSRDMRGSRNFRQGGGGGGPGQTDKKSSGSIGGPTFSRGGGVQLLIPYRNPYNL